MPASAVQPARILIVDDDPIVADSLADFLRTQGHRVSSALDAAAALSLLDDSERPPKDGAKASEPFAVVISDIALPRMNGLELLRRIAAEHPGVAVIMLTAYGTIESAVQALRLGACDYLTKPVIDVELRLSLERALRQQVLLAENRTLRRQLDKKSTPGSAEPGMAGLVGSDHRMLKVYELIQAVAPSRTTVLMTGESGTGKSLIARAIHDASPRRDKPFVELSCGSIPETLLESELFGHVKGAFTGAHVDKVGRFLAANGGTIFLDEINSASAGMQLKLLRVLQERKFEPVGSSQTVEVDVRVVLATNQPLEILVADGRFRQDLYYRINVVKIELAPLRERTADIPQLAGHFLRIYAAELGKQLTGFSPEALEALRRYRYPGNVRELQNIVERAAVLSKRPTIVPDDLPPQVASPADTAGFVGPSAAAPAAEAPWSPMPLEQALLGPERLILLGALKANNWNRQKTAEQLGINRTTLYKKMKLHNIEAHDAA